MRCGGMFLRITQNGESVPALVALWCADKRLFVRARWMRIVVFLQSCDRSQCDLMTSHALVRVTKSSALRCTHSSHISKTFFFFFFLFFFFLFFFFFFFVVSFFSLCFIFLIFSFLFFPLFFFFFSLFFFFFFFLLLFSSFFFFLFFFSLFFLFFLLFFFHPFFPLFLFFPIFFPFFFLSSCLPFKCPHSSTHGTRTISATRNPTRTLHSRVLCTLCSPAPRALRFLARCACSVTFAVARLSAYTFFCVFRFVHSGAGTCLRCFSVAGGAVCKPHVTAGLESSGDRVHGAGACLREGGAV